MNVDDDLRKRLGDASDEYIKDLVTRLSNAITVGDIRTALGQGGDYSRDVELAFPFLIKTNEKACEALLSVLLNDCINLRYTLEARALVARLPREWVLLHVESAAHDWLADDDQDSHLLILELYNKISPAHASRLANHLLTNADEAMRQIGKDYLDSSQEK